MTPAGASAIRRLFLLPQKVVGDEGIEPSFHDYESHTFTIKLIPFFIYMRRWGADLFVPL